MNDSIKTIVTATAGEAAIMTTDAAIPDETIQLILQLVIGVVTLIRLFKTDKKKK